MTVTSPLDPVLRKLDALLPLSAEDKIALSSMKYDVAALSSDSCIVRQGTRSDTIYALIEGYAYRSKNLTNGRRQIVSIHVPGDLLNLHDLMVETVVCNVATLRSATVAKIPTSCLLALRDQNSAIAEALWLDAMFDAAVAREWTTNLGLRPALARIAHLLAEFGFRRAAMGMPSKFILPMTQQQIAEACGLTPIHVNRVVKQLVAEEAITKRGGRLVIDDLTTLCRIAHFDAGYLQPLASSSVPTGANMLAGDEVGEPHIPIDLQANALLFPSGWRCG